MSSMTYRFCPGCGDDLLFEFPTPRTCLDCDWRSLEGETLAPEASPERTEDEDKALEAFEGLMKVADMVCPSYKLFHPRDCICKECQPSDSKPDQLWKSTVTKDEDATLDPACLGCQGKAATHSCSPESIRIAELREKYKGHKVLLRRRRPHSNYYDVTDITAEINELLTALDDSRESGRRWKGHWLHCVDKIKELEAALEARPEPWRLKKRLKKATDKIDQQRRVINDLQDKIKRRSDKLPQVLHGKEFEGEWWVLLDEIDSKYYRAQTEDDEGPQSIRKVNHGQ